MKVYERIKIYIKESGLKQKVVATKAGYTEKQFSEMLNGKRPLYADDVEKICVALGVPPDTFILYQGSKQRGA